MLLGCLLKRLDHQSFTGNDLETVGCTNLASGPGCFPLFAGVESSGRELTDFASFGAGIGQPGVG
jgi:hypothetical protein